MKFLDEKMKKILILLGVLIVVLILGALLINLLKGSTLSYDKIEDKLVSAAKSYYKDNEGLLPIDEKDIVEVTDATLSDGGYMKDISKYVKDKNTSCSGKVSVSKSSEGYFYSPYLNCGDKFTTKYLYEQLLNDLTEQDEGLYKTTQYTSTNKTENMYVYRGEVDNNYIKIGDVTFRVVKMDSNYNIFITQEYIKKSYTLKSAWDDKYNNVVNFEHGINDYYRSNIRKELKRYLTEYYDNSVKEKMVLKDICIGNKRTSDTTKNGSTECKEIISNDYLSLITTYDFMSASLDKNCTTIISRSCTNENYLTDYGKSFWLMNASQDNTDKGFFVSAGENLNEKYLSIQGYARVAFYISSNTTFTDGNGTVNNPYIVK